MNKLKIGLLSNKKNLIVPVAMFGLGGTYVEVIKKIHFIIIPLTRPNAMYMKKQINFQPLLLGFRRGKKIDIEECIGIILKLARITQMSPDISDIESNPILNFEQINDVLASDIRILLDPTKKKYSCDNIVGDKNSK